MERQRVLLVKQRATVGQLVNLLGELAGIKRVEGLELTTEARRAQRRKR